MKRKIITTADGSKTIQIEDWNEQYHSLHGAVQEANHVFLKHGLLFYIDQLKENKKTSEKDSINILEIGFGTGLNAILTLLTAESNALHIEYTGVEAYPVTMEEVRQLEYHEHLNISREKFNTLHEVPWEVSAKISDEFSLIKQQKFFKEINAVSAYDIIYFDAFGARVQPELWSDSIFNTMYQALKPNGVMTTYAAIGRVRRTLQEIGFEVERLQGPPGKRHMMRAIKR